MLMERHCQGRGMVSGGILFIIIVYLCLNNVNANNIIVGKQTIETTGTILNCTVEKDERLHS